MRIQEGPDWTYYHVRCAQRLSPSIDALVVRRMMEIGIPIGGVYGRGSPSGSDINAGYW